MPRVQDVNKLTGVLAPIRNLAPPYKQSRRSRRKRADPGEHQHQDGADAPPDIVNNNASSPGPSGCQVEVGAPPERSPQHHTVAQPRTWEVPASNLHSDRHDEHIIPFKPDDDSTLVSAPSNSPHLSNASDALQMPFTPFEVDLITKDNDAVFAVGPSLSPNAILRWCDSEYSSFLEGPILGSEYAFEGGVAM